MRKLDSVMRLCGIILLWALAAVGLPAQTFTTLYTFGPLPDSEAPYAPLVQAADGNFYSTTAQGGANNGGSVFKMTPSGSLAVFYSFCSQSNCKDGSYPDTGLVQVGDGDFYGTTETSVFKITPGGTLTTLHLVCSLQFCADGYVPSQLVQGIDGNFYGSMTYGGVNVDCLEGTCGTIFKITPGGVLTTLHSFGQTDGRAPEGALVQGPDGNFYGTTVTGGIGHVICPAFGCGTVFKITPSGTLTTLRDFRLSDGAYPQGALVLGADGYFYGTTTGGGANTNVLCTGYGFTGCGTVFKVTASGTLTSLYSFCSESSCQDGVAPQQGLLLATDGNFYGTTYYGGTNGGGTLFEITPDGALTTLYNFCSQTGCADGGSPSAALVQGTNGVIYGTASGGGIDSGCVDGGCGTVFSLSLGLGPFVEPQLSSGAVGAAINILGTNLADATSVTFNSTAAVFIVVSPSLITTTVPAGATNGKIQVVTPKGTLKSNVPFQVLP